MARVGCDTTIFWPEITSLLINCPLDLFEAFDNPGESGGVAEYHALHGGVVLFDLGAELQLGNDAGRAHDRFVELLPALTECDLVVVPNSRPKIVVIERASPDLGLADHRDIVVVARDAVTVGRQAALVAVSAMSAMKDEHLFPKGAGRLDSGDAAGGQVPSGQLIGDEGGNGSWLNGRRFRS